MAFLRAGLRSGHCERPRRPALLLPGPTLDRASSSWTASGTLIPYRATRNRSSHLFEKSSGSLRSSPRLRPKVRIDRQCAHLPSLRIEEGAVMGELSVPEELRQHRQRAGSDRLVDERLLPVEGFHCRTTRQWVLSPIRGSDFRE